MEAATAKPEVDVAGWREMDVSRACVRHKASRLSVAPDGAETVAEAAVDACWYQLTSEVQAETKDEPKATRSSAYHDQLEIDQAWLKREALAAVVSARAGHCE